MKKLFLLLALIFAVPVSMSAQYDDDEEEAVEDQVDAEDEQDANEEVVDGIVRKQHIKAKKPLMPAYVREANVLWSKTVWRLIDLRQKQNLYLYYPTQDIDERKSLTRTLFDAIMDGEVTAYKDGDNEFAEPIQPHEVFRNIYKADYPNEDYEPDSVVTTNPETGKEEVHYVVQYNAESFTGIRQIRVKEVWFFDKRYGRMEVRILGLCPVSFMERQGNQYIPYPLFWVYYPEAANVLAHQEAYSYHNDAQRVSLRDKLETRQFASYIYRESNVYNNRVVEAITNSGIDQNMEAQRIQADIFQHEHDMWEY